MIPFHDDCLLIMTFVVVMMMPMVVTRLTPVNFYIVVVAFDNDFIYLAMMVMIFMVIVVMVRRTLVGIIDFVIVALDDDLRVAVVVVAVMVAVVVVTMSFGMRAEDINHIDETRTGPKNCLADRISENSLQRVQLQEIVN